MPLAPETVALWIAWTEFDVPLWSHRGFDEVAFESLCATVRACSARWANESTIPRMAANCLCTLASKTSGNAYGYRNIPHRVDVYQRAKAAAAVLSELVGACVRPSAAHAVDDVSDIWVLVVAWDRFIAQLRETGEIATQHRSTLNDALDNYATKWSNMPTVSKPAATPLSSINREMEECWRQYEDPERGPISRTWWELSNRVDDCLLITESESAELQALLERDN